MAARKREQISVPLPIELRERLEAIAHREDRTLAQQVRHLLAEAMRNLSTSREAA
jgi:predicted DNA-binding protein